MAFASSRIGAQEAIIKPCDLCEDEDDVNWFCKDCIQNLCERCKKMHLKIVTCRNHQLVPILEGFAIQKTNVSNLCQDHKEPFSFFCRSCEESICSICLSMVHKKHDFTDLPTLQSEFQSKLENYIREKEDEEMKMAKNIDDLEKCENQCRETITKCYTAIDNRIEDIHNAVNEEGNNIKESLKTSSDKQLKEVQERKQKVQGRKNEYADTIKTIKQELTLQTASTCVQFVKTSTSKLQSLKPMMYSFTKGIRFTAGMTSKEIVADMIGKTMSQLEVKELHGIGQKGGISIMSGLLFVLEHKLNALGVCYSLCTSLDGSIWLGGEGYVYKMNSDCSTVLHKTPTRTFGLPILHIVCLQTGDAIVSYNERMASDGFFTSPKLKTYIDRVTSDGRRVEFKNKSGEATRAMAVTNHDEVVIAFIDVSQWRKTPLVKYPKEGTELNIMSLDKKVASFCINTEGNYVTSDELSSHLITLDDKGNVLKKIQISEPGLRQMRCDRYGNILGLSRCTGSKSIHLISDDGGVERSFTVECDHRINDICIDNDNRLLILADERKVIVAEYLE